MRLFLLACMFLLFAQMAAGQKNIANDKKPSEIKVETVDFCKLILNPTNYEGKEVRTVAILVYGGEDFIVLYCPKCYETGVIKPVFTDYFRTQTKGKRIGKLPRLKNSSGTVKLILVGKFSTQQLLIDSVEKAIYLSKESHFPDRLSSKTRQKADCKEK